MTPALARAASWGVFAVAAGTLMAACHFKMQTYEFNRFLLLLIAVPPLMLIALRRVLDGQEARSRTQKS